jgi:iron complex transport system ATP-binding protein
VLRAAGLEYAFGDVPVVRGVDVRVDAGELLCVVGANGAGKTTLLRLLGGLLVPSGGRVRCFGLDPARVPRPQIARRLSYLPQDYQIAFPFTVGEVVLMGRYAHRRRGLLDVESEADLEAARAAMRRTDVLALAGRRFDELSGGERRRALLAQALCQRAELLLLDEPTASLDPAHAIALFDALVGACGDRSAAAVVVTHDLNLAARFADRVVLIADGAVAADGPAAEVLASEATRRAFHVPMHVGTLPGSDTPFVVPART